MTNFTFQYELQILSIVKNAINNSLSNHFAVIKKKGIPQNQPYSLPVKLSPIKLLKSNFVASRLHYISHKITYLAFSCFIDWLFLHSFVFNFDSKFVQGRNGNLQKQAFARISGSIASVKLKLSLLRQFDI